MKLIIEVDAESMKVLVDLANIGYNHLEEGDFTQKEINSFSPLLVQLLDEIDKNIKTRRRTSRTITRTRTYHE